MIEEKEIILEQEIEEKFINLEVSEEILINSILQNKDVIPSKEIQIVTADENYDGLDQVNVQPIPDEYIIPNGTLDVSENGNVDVTNFKMARVGVYTPPNLQDKSIDITQNGIISIVADEGYDGLNSVEVITNIAGASEGTIIDKQYIDTFVLGTINGENPPNYINSVNDNRAQYIGFNLKIIPGEEYTFVGGSSSCNYAVMQIGQDTVDAVNNGEAFNSSTFTLANTGWSSNSFKFTAVEGATYVWISAKKTSGSDFTTSDLKNLLPCYIEGPIAIEEDDEPVVSQDYITDGLVSWWEGEDGFDENAQWHSRVGTDYISPATYGYGDASTNPPITDGKAVYNNGVYGFVTQQDYCIKDYTIQVVGLLEGSASMSGTTMNMLIGFNMGASPMIGVNGSGNGQFVNGSNISHEKTYSNMTKRIFNASLNLVTPPTRSVSSTTELSYSVNGGSWHTATNKSEGHASKGNNMTVLCYYTATYRSLGAKIYSIRVYNRKLTEEELIQNYKIDKARFGIEDYIG